MSCPFGYDKNKEALNRLTERLSLNETENKQAPVNSDERKTPVAAPAPAAASSAPRALIDTADESIPHPTFGYKHQGLGHPNSSTLLGSIDSSKTEPPATTAILPTDTPSSWPQGSSSDVSWEMGVPTSLGADVAFPEFPKNIKRYTEHITYWNYIHPDVLTSLQNGRQGLGLNHHEEHLFILVHQVFELWFKQIIFELEYVRAAMLGTAELLTGEDPMYRASIRLDRADKVMRLATKGYEIMETMDPADFLEFRDYLTPSSGFQSAQMREIEIILGLKDEDRIMCAGRPYQEAFLANNEDKTGVLLKRMSEPTVCDAVNVWLKTLDLPGMDAFLKSFLAIKEKDHQDRQNELKSEIDTLDKLLEKAAGTPEEDFVLRLRKRAEYHISKSASHFDDTKSFFCDPELGRARTAALMIFTYHGFPRFCTYARLLNSILSFEQGTIIWRQRHARMVEMFIGRRVGTGGSSGVEYLDATAQTYRVFTDLWRIRSLEVAMSRLSFHPTRLRSISNPSPMASPSASPTGSPSRCPFASASLASIPPITPAEGSLNVNANANESPASSAPASPQSIIQASSQ